MAKKYLAIEEELREFDVDLFNGSIIKLAAELQGFQDDYPDHTNLRFWIDQHYECVEIKLMGTRQETDRERDKRLTRARKERNLKAEAKAQKEAAEKTELKRLLEKYGEELING